MSSPNITSPGVNIRIEGIIPLMFKWDGRRIIECHIGPIRNVPEHFFSFEIQKNGATVALNATENLKLQVTDTTQTDISLRLPNEQIDRVTGDGNQASFAWVPDFEGSEIYNTGVGIDTTKLGPKLVIDRGELFTINVSDNHLLKRLPTEAQWTLIGKVATVVGAHIDLDRRESSATLIHGDFPVQGTRTARGEQLDITIKMSRPSHQGHPHPNDANHYHIALAPNLEPQQKLKFTSTPLLPTIKEATPEASCLTGRLGTTPASDG